MPAGKLREAQTLNPQTRLHTRKAAVICGAPARATAATRAPLAGVLLFWS